jgi:hypothetical protein
MSHHTRSPVRMPSSAASISPADGARPWFLAACPGSRGHAWPPTFPTVGGTVTISMGTAGTSPPSGPCRFRVRSGGDHPPLWSRDDRVFRACSWQRTGGPSCLRTAPRGRAPAYPPDGAPALYVQDGPQARRPVHRARGLGRSSARRPDLRSCHGARCLRTGGGRLGDSTAASLGRRLCPVVALAVLARRERTVSWVHRPGFSTTRRARRPIGAVSLRGRRCSRAAPARLQGSPPRTRLARRTGPVPRERYRPRLASARRGRSRPAPGRRTLAHRTVDHLLTGRSSVRSPGMRTARLPAFSTSSAVVRASCSSSGR